MRDRQPARTPVGLIEIVCFRNLYFGLRLKIKDREKSRLATRRSDSWATRMTAPLCMLQMMAAGLKINQKPRKSNFNVTSLSN